MKTRHKKPGTKQTVKRVAKKRKPVKLNHLHELFGELQFFDKVTQNVRK